MSPRPCTKQNRLLAGAVPFHMVWTGYNQRGAARARRKRACCASSRERVSAVARSRVRTRASRMPVVSRGRYVGARPCTLYQKREASRWRSALLKGMNRLRPARRARAASVRATPHPEREIAQWRDRVCAHAQDGCSLEAAAGTSEHGFAPKERALSLVQCPSIRHESNTTSAARRASASSARAAPPPERERAQWRDRVWAHAQAGCSLEA